MNRALAAHAAVHRREQGGRNLDQVDSALEQMRRDGSHITDRASPDREHEAATRNQRSCLQNLLEHGKSLGPLTAERLHQRRPRTQRARNARMQCEHAAIGNRQDGSRGARTGDPCEQIGKRAPAIAGAAIGAGGPSEPGLERKLWLELRPDAGALAIGARGRRAPGPSWPR